MKSIFLLCAVIGAASDASKCQADENTLLQGLSTMRKVKKTAAGSKDAKAMLKEMREMADSWVEGSDSTMSEDDLRDSLQQVGEATATIREATLQQVANAQQQLIDASGGFQACTTEELTGLQERVEQRAAAVESCQSTLAQKRTAETRQCATAEDCLCDEARVRTTDQEALCTAVTETYEVVFCEQHHMCTISQQCHSLEAGVYQRLVADVQAEMGLIVEEYRAAEQTICLNRLMVQHMTGGSRRTVIPQAAMDACDDVDVSGLNINPPAVPAPPTCPAATHGGPQCGDALAAYRWHWPGRFVWGHPLAVYDGDYTPKQCAEICDAEPGCRAFEYVPPGSTCCTPTCRLQNTGAYYLTRDSSRTPRTRDGSRSEDMDLYSKR